MNPSTATPLLHDYLLTSARRLPEKVALVASRRRVTYAEIDGGSNALAHALVRRGIHRGDRVVVFLDNSVEATTAFWAVLKANAVVSMVHPHTKPDKLSYLLGDCRARSLITSTDLLPTATLAVRRSPHLRSVIVAGAGSRVEGAGERERGLSVVGWAQALAAEPSAEPPPRMNLDVDLASIIYTSGSTGEPKGVMLTHRNMLTAATSITTYLENVEADVILGCLPMSFDYGLYQMIMAFKVGARVILEKSFAYPSEILTRMAAERVTGFPGVPTIFAMLTEMKSIREHDLSALRYVTNTAAALPAKLILFLRELFPRARLYSMYGLTECKRCTYLPPADVDRKPSSVGIAIPNTELWLVDDDGRRLGPNTTGQLVVRGSTVMAGYWEKPDETAKKLRPGPLPGERVLYTGDLCRMDDEGYLYFVSRMDDIIKSRGEKVAPKEIEAVLCAVPGVKEAAVIGVRDELLGEAPKAFVAFEPGVTIEISELRRICRERLESFMVPKHFEVVRALPKSHNGKIDKRQLA